MEDEECDCDVPSWSITGTFKYSGVSNRPCGQLPCRQQREGQNYGLSVLEREPLHHFLERIVAGECWIIMPNNLAQLYSASKKNAVVDSKIRAMLATGVVLTKKGSIKWRELRGCLSAATLGLEWQELLNSSKKNSYLCSDGSDAGDDSFWHFWSAVSTRSIRTGR